MNFQGWSQRLRIRLQKGFFTSIVGLTFLGIVFAAILTFAGVYTYYYIKYSRMIDARLSGRVLQNTTQLFSAPQQISVGEVWTEGEMTTYLTKVGYRPVRDENSLGHNVVLGNTVEIRPSKLSYFAATNGLSVQFVGKTIKSIRPLSGGTDFGSAAIEPELITNLFDSAREKRRPVLYQDLPPALVHAIMSAEDKRYLEHGGVDVWRLFCGAGGGRGHTQ